jgi:hypothetical protein
LVSRPPIVSIGITSIPSTSVGTQIIVMPACLSSLRVVRQTTRTWSEMWALEQKTFWPLRMKPPSTRSALQESAPTSEPASGSVIAIASTEPEAMPPRISSFWDSVPKRWVAPATISVVA